MKYPNIDGLSDNISGYLSKNFGDEYLKSYLEFVNTEPFTFVRFPLDETEHQSLLHKLSMYGIKLHRMEEIPFAYKVVEGFEKISKTLEFNLGQYYIQSLSSMLPPLVLNPSSTDKVLDLCGAPGSKATQLSAMMNNTGELLINEPSGDRVKALVHNIDKLSVVNAGVIKYKGEWLSKVFQNYFDKILVDAPCSALGIIQKKGEVNNWWNEQHALKIAELQMKILVAAIKMLKIGGELVYSTCTLTVEENEFIINKVLEKYPLELVDVELPIPSVGGFTEINGIEMDPSLSKTRRIIPWVSNSEGFFVAKLKKADETKQPDKMNFPSPEYKLMNADHKSIKKYLNYLSDYFGIPIEHFHSYKYLLKKNDVYFVDKNWDAHPVSFFLRIGQKFGIIDKRDELVLHSQAARILGEIAVNNFIIIDNRDDLKTYFTGGTIKKDFTEFGKKIVKYDNYTLGMAVITQEGLKSQYPRALRTQEIIFPDGD